MALLSFFTAFLACHVLVDAGPAKKAESAGVMLPLPLDGVGPGPIAETRTLDLAAIAAELGELPSVLPHFNGILPVSKEKRSIIGPDNRYQFSDTRDSPYRTTGKVYSAEACSGVLVGTKLVLTARHCLNNSVTPNFQPDFDNNKPTLGTYYATYKFIPQIPNDVNCQILNDWGLIVLDTPIGNYLGYTGVGLPDASRYGAPILTSMGYPGDRDSGTRPYRQDGISVISARTSARACNAGGPLVS